MRESDFACNAAREVLTEEKEKSAIHSSQMKTMSDTLDTVAVDRDEIRDNLVSLEDELKNLPRSRKKTRINNKPPYKAGGTSGPSG